MRRLRCHHHHHQQQQQQRQQKKLPFINFLWLLTIVLITAQDILAIETLDTIPHLCDAVKCPSLHEITCPQDSDVREFDLTTETIASTRNVTISKNDELYVPCCLAKKCICKTCYIPDCNKTDQVVVEIVPESMEVPGHCCGKYECQQEPNCTELYNTDDIHWLTNCQRCKCYAGQRLCHQSCDEDLNKKSRICHSKSLNKFFEHGDTWKDGCLECECVNGEPKCVITFCRNAGCPTNRQVLQNGRCCPICWPEGRPLPNSRETYEDDGGDDDEETYEEDEEDKLIEDSESGNHYDEDESGTPIAVPTISNEHNDFIPSIEWEKSSAFFPTPLDHDNKNVDRKITEITTDDNVADMSKTHELYPQVVELMRYNQPNDLLYTIIVVLSIVVVILAAWNIHLRAKQRSYRPVSHFDDNFNRMTSNIKKTNDYV